MSPSSLIFSPWAILRLAPVLCLAVASLFAPPAAGQAPANGLADESAVQIDPSLRQAIGDQIWAQVIDRPVSEEPFSEMFDETDEDADMEEEGNPDELDEPGRTGVQGWLDERLWTQCYFQSEYSRDDRHNIVNDGWIKTGLHLFEMRGRPLDLYLKTRLLHDRNRDFWNNRGEIGLGLQYRPFEDLGLVLYAEVLDAIATGREGVDRNLEKDPFVDYRGGGYFWQWWGRYPWEVENTEWYLPFTGWREVYGDAIFYYHDNNNFITTVDFKEGLALGRVGPVQFDAYLGFEGGFDINRDYWNNYAQVGPGIRITPFEALDLKIGMEYVEGRYFSGAMEDGQSRSYSDFIVTLAFFYEF